MSLGMARKAANLCQKLRSSGKPSLPIRLAKPLPESGQWLYCIIRIHLTIRSSRKSYLRRKITHMFDMMKMMGKVKEMQDKLKAAQESLGTLRASGESGAGMVKATVNGKKQLVSLDIDPTILKSDDKMLV